MLSFFEQQFTNTSSSYAFTQFDQQRCLQNIVDKD